MSHGCHMRVEERSDTTLSIINRCEDYALSSAVTISDRKEAFCNAANRLRAQQAEIEQLRAESSITPAGLAHVTTTAIHTVADVKDATIARLTAERDSNSAYFDRFRAEVRKALDAPPAMSLVGCALILRESLAKAERDRDQARAETSELQTNRCKP